MQQWWDGAVEPFDAESFADSRVARWIVSHEARPFGYIQDYDPQGWDGHPFAHLPLGSRGIDQFIGPDVMRGQGHGQGFISAHMDRLFSEGAPVIATDPHPGNARAIHVYESVGFSIEGPARMTQWGLILPMTAHR